MAIVGLLTVVVWGRSDIACVQGMDFCTLCFGPVAISDYGSCAESYDRFFEKIASSPGRALREMLRTI